jgi:hypothetical protein
MWNDDERRRQRDDKKATIQSARALLQSAVDDQLRRAPTAAAGHAAADLQNPKRRALVRPCVTLIIGAADNDQSHEALALALKVLGRSLESCFRKFAAMLKRAPNSVCEATISGRGKRIGVGGLKLRATTSLGIPITQAADGFRRARPNTDRLRSLSYRAQSSPLTP